MKLPLEGGCLCGGVRYRISAAPSHADYCHCRMCQRSTGAPVVPWLTVASAEFAWSTGEPAVYRSSQKAERLFCPRCGSQLVFREPAEPDHLDVTVASLDDPAADPPDPPHLDHEPDQLVRGRGRPAALPGARARRRGLSLTRRAAGGPANPWCVV